MTEPPVLRIVAGGAPSDEETAALTAVLSALTVGSEAQHQSGGRETASRWRDSGRPATTSPGDGWLAQARRSALRRPQ